MGISNSTALEDNKFSALKPLTQRKQTSKIHLLVEGYFKQHTERSQSIIPMDVLTICYHFYYITSLNIFIIPQDIGIPYLQRAKFHLLMPRQNNKLITFKHIDNDPNWLYDKPKHYSLCYIPNFQCTATEFVSTCSKYKIKNASALMICSNKRVLGRCAAVIFDENEANNSNMIERAFLYKMAAIPIKYRWNDRNSNVRRFTSIYSTIEECVYLQDGHNMNIFKLNMNDHDRKSWHLKYALPDHTRDKYVSSQLCAINNYSNLFSAYCVRSSFECSKTYFQIFDIECKHSKQIYNFQHKRQVCITSNLCYDAIHEKVYYHFAPDSVYLHDLITNKRIRKQLFGAGAHACNNMTKLWLDNSLLFMAKLSQNHKWRVVHYDTRTNNYKFKWTQDCALTDILNSFNHRTLVHV